MLFRKRGYMWKFNFRLSNYDFCIFKIAPLSLNFPHVKRIPAGNFLFFQHYLFCKWGLVYIFILFFSFYSILIFMILNIKRWNSFYQEFGNIIIFFVFFHFDFASTKFLFEDWIITLGNYKNYHTIYVLENLWLINQFFPSAFYNNVKK